MGLGYDPYGRIASVAYPDADNKPFAVQNEYDEYDDYGHLLAVKDATTDYWTLTATA